MRWASLMVGRVVALWLLPGLAFAGEAPQPPPFSVSPEQAAAGFELAPGFQLALVAGEPAVLSPVAMAFDESGRLFVVESPRAASGQGVQPVGRVRLLTDLDGEGVYRGSSIFADGLTAPSAIACYDGGVFVATAREVLFFKDTRGKGTADLRRTVITGFSGANAAGGPALIRDLQWGLDNRFHAASGGDDGSVHSPAGGNSAEQSLYGADFSFDPRTGEFRLENGAGAAAAQTLDNFGRRFVSSPDHPLRVEMYGLRYLLRNPFFVAAPAWRELLAPATRIYPAANFAGTAQWIAPSACAIYRGSAYPTNFAGDLFIADTAARVVHRAVLRSNALTWVARPAPTEAKSEFLRGTDPAFRPSQLVNGPDGCLYLADARLSPGEGRIYRIQPKGFRAGNPVTLGKADTRELAAALVSANGWYGDTAARLLFERQDRAAAPLLGKMAERAASPVARARALRALDGLGALGTEHITRGLRDADWAVRVQAAELAESLLEKGAASEALLGGMEALADDLAEPVRYQLTLTLGEVRAPGKPALLARALERDFQNDWMRSAALSSSEFGAAPFCALLARSRVGLAPEGGAFLANLAGSVGEKGRLEEVAGFIQLLAGESLKPELRLELAAALGEGLRRTASSLGLVDPQRSLQPVYVLAIKAALDDASPLARRIEALRIIAAAPLPFEEVGDWLLLLCNPRSPEPLQAAAVETLSALADPRALPAVLERWPALAPGARRAGTTAFATKTEFLPGVLAALAARRIAPAEFAPEVVNWLRTSGQETVRSRALAAFGELRIEPPEALQRAEAALKLNGIAARGRVIYEARCARCHEPGFMHLRLGPIVRGARLSKNEVLSAILEPNATIDPSRSTRILESKTGEFIIGVGLGENPAALTLGRADGSVVVWPRLNAREVKAPAWSMMPEGLERQLSPQSLADLLEYVTAPP